MTLTEAEDSKKRWQEYTEDLYKKGLNDLNNQDGELTHSLRAQGLRKHYYKQS